MFTEIYSIAGDFPNLTVAPSVLRDEVVTNASFGTSPQPVCLGVNTLADVCNIVFDIALTGPQQAILDGIVALHLGAFSVVPNLAMNTSLDMGDVAAGTTSATYQDAFASRSALVEVDGYYFLILDSEVTGTDNTNIIEIALVLNATFLLGALASSELAGSARSCRPGNNRQAQITSTTGALFLSAGDTVHGVFRRLSGGGTSNILRRRLTIFKLADEK